MTPTQQRQMAVRLRKEADRLEASADKAEGVGVKGPTRTVTTKKGKKTPTHGHFGELKKKLKTLKPGTAEYKRVKARLDEAQGKAGGRKVGFSAGG